MQNLSLPHSSALLTSPGEHPRGSHVGKGRGGQCRYPLKLAGFWTAQGLWAWVCLLPITVGQAIAPAAPLGPLALLGTAAFVGGFAMETIADYQKFVFKNDPANKDRCL